MLLNIVRKETLWTLTISQAGVQVVIKCGLNLKRLWRQMFVGTGIEL